MILAGAWKARSVKGPAYPDVAHVSHGEKNEDGNECSRLWTRTTINLNYFSHDENKFLSQS